MPTTPKAGAAKAPANRRPTKAAATKADALRIAELERELGIAQAEAEPAKRTNRAAAKKAGRCINLNAARIARAEAEHEPVRLEIGDGMFELPVEMPVNFLRLIRTGDLDGGLASLLGDEQAEAFFAQNVSMGDLTALVDIAMEVYGVSEGK